jgi:hypothetical protein
MYPICSQTHFRYSSVKANIFEYVLALHRSRPVMLVLPAVPWYCFNNGGAGATGAVYMKYLSIYLSYVISSYLFLSYLI